mgnify:CR=1 FL=1
MNNKSPFISQKPHLINLPRVRIPENRDLDESLRLNRNERVKSWDKDLLEKIFSDKKSNFLCVYPDLSNIYTKLSNYLGVNEEEILITSGIDGGIKTLFEIVTEPGDTIGVLAPTYAMYSVYSKIFQTQLTEVSYDPETLKLNFEDLDDLIKKKPKIIFLPNPNQPVEFTLEIHQIEEIAKQTEKNKTLLVIDEAYFGFGSESSVKLINKFKNIVVARTFSKGFGMPAIRLGFLISNKKNMEILSKTRFAHEVDALNIAVGEYILDNIHIVEEYNLQVIESREDSKLKLKDMGINSYGQKGNYLFIDLETKEKCQKIVNTLLEQKIYVKSNFNEPWEKYILITLGPIKEMSRFFSVLRKCLNTS